MENNKRPETMERITTTALAQAFIDEQLAAIKAQVGDKKVLLALSGGVDSSVVAALLIRAIGQNLVCVHVNHGLLRKGEPEQVIEVFRNQMNANLVYVDAVDRFLDKLAGVAEPEKKRKIIGAEFIRVFEEEARKQDGIEFLAQGTIYPDILESGPVKAHHNVGGLPEDLRFALVEPLKFLFKDEVRVVGKRSVCRTTWSIVSRFRDLVWACAALVRSRETDWKPCANPTRSCGKNLQPPVLPERCGSTSRSCRISSRSVSGTISAPSSTRSSCAPSTPRTP